MAAPASRLRSLLRVLGWALLGLAALVGILAATLFLVGRSDWGRRQILNAVLPALRPVLTGELRVGALDGDLTHMLVLRDVNWILGLAAGLVTYIVGMLTLRVLAGDDWDLLYRLAAALPGGKLILRYWKRDVHVNW